MVYDELMLMFAKAKQRELWQEAQRHALVQRAKAESVHRYERWLRRLSNALIVCGLKLRALCQQPLAKSAPVSLGLLDLAEQPGGRPGPVIP